ncbi:MAG: hypothetical protein EBX41_04630, partial [Chitinophagia bacterium]|nr:hypothetical protein [Chitinophagia bacterium]
QYAAQLDERGILVGKPLQLGSVKTGIFGAMKTYFYNVVSDNKQQIVIYSVKQWAKEMEIDFRWLNDSMQLVKKSKATFKTQENLEYGYINVANDGTIYISAYTPTGTHGYADQMWLLSLAPGETRFVEHPLPLNDKYISNGYTRIDNINNKVYFGGYYSNSRNGNSDGIIYASYNISSGQYETVNFLPIDDTLLNALDAAKGSRTFENYDVRQIIPKNDGGFVLISESYYMTNRSSYMPGLGYYSTFYSPYNTTMVKEYHYEDILAISCNASGHREWCSLIPKEQYSQDDGGVFASYLLLNSGGSLSFLFNDFNSLRSRIQLATIDNNGTVTHGGFNLAKNDESDWLPKAGKQVAARVLIVPCLRKKQICFAKVVF